MNQLNPLQILQNLAPVSVSLPIHMPEPNAQISVGQIRSITFENSEQDLDRRFVVVTSMPSRKSMILQVMLIGSDISLSGRNDVLLLENERPTPFDTVIQTELKFPVLRSDLGALFSVLKPSTIELLANMGNYSGRDISRIGFHRNDADVIRQDYLRDELQIVRNLSRNAFIAMQGHDYKAEQVELLDIPNLDLAVRELKNASMLYRPLPVPAQEGSKDVHSKQEKLELLRQLRTSRRTKDMVAA